MANLPKIILVKRKSGKGRGKKIGIPTLNFEIPKDLTLPHGIYAGWLRMGNKQYKTAIHFGPRPVFKEKDVSLEAYILDKQTFDYEGDLELEFITFIRNVQSFSSVEKMLNQIEKDLGEIRKILR